jgi:selenide,water dikinase
MPQGRLAQVLRALHDQGDGRLLVGPETFDDAGVFELGGGGALPSGQRTALVQTVDFFPPVVDDPYWYGAIAAANALSDVYAMGGTPITALCLAALPKEFPEEWTAEIFRGGFEKVREAGAVVAGGHTVEADIQFGFSVTGLVDPARMTANSNARAGDQVYLTKPLGMGSLTTGAKQKQIRWEEIEPRVKSMAALNDRACAAMLAAGARAATDVTGYGLVGHGRNLAKASGVTLRVEVLRAPIDELALELARREVFSGGRKRGMEGLKDEVAIAGGLDSARVGVLFDAETSGGLLIAIAPERAPLLERELAARALPVVRLGEFVPFAGRSVELV